MKPNSTTDNRRSTVKSDIILDTSITASSILQSEVEKMKNGAYDPDCPDGMAEEIGQKVKELRDIIFDWQKKIKKD